MAKNTAVAKIDEQYAKDLETATPEQLAAVLRLAREQFRLTLQAAKLQAELDDVMKRLRVIGESDLPTAMADAGADTVPLGNGYVVKAETTVYATISEEKWPTAQTWLEKHGHADIIKHQVRIEFSRDEDAFFRKFCRDLAQRKKAVNAAVKDFVHPQTLWAFVREQIGKGVEIPRDVFGVYEKTITQITAPKGSPALPRLRKEKE